VEEFIDVNLTPAPPANSPYRHAGILGFVFGHVWQRPGLNYVRASDEHGVIDIARDAAAPALGEKLLLVPGHCDPTVNLYDEYVCVRGGRVEALWPISARGALR